MSEETNKKALSKKYAERAKRRSAAVYQQMKDNPDDKHHGTTYGYVCGCRCERCVKAAKELRDRNRAKYLKELQTNPDDKRHGTIYGYSIGCRCERCKAANRKYNKKYNQLDASKKVRQANVSKALDEMQHDRRDPRHGTKTGYQYGCRCPRCVEANKQSVREYREKYRQELLNNPNDPRHGTDAGYTYGCRCEKCKAVRVAYTEKYNKNRKQHGED